MRCEFLDPLITPEWNMFIREHHNATIFHTAQWARVLTEAYGYRPYYAVLRNTERIVGIVPVMEVDSVWTGRRGVCLPFSDECAPVLVDQVNMAPIMERIREFGTAHRWDYFELRGGNDVGSSATRTGQFVTHQLALESAEGPQLLKLRDSTRRNVQRAVREGVEVSHLESVDAIERFYSLHCRTRRRHGLPPQPLRFFHLIHRHLIEPGFGFVTLAHFNGRCIAGSVFLHFGSQAIYKFGAADLEFQHTRASNLVMWAGICRLQRERIAQLSLGRSEKTDEGLLQFKRGWGGKEVELSYHRIPLLKRSMKDKLQRTDATGDSFSRKIMRHLPLSVLRLIGGAVYRHAG